MSAQVFDGKTLQSRLTRRIKRETERLRKQQHIDVGLGIIVVTGDQVSMSDATKISGIAEELGISIHTERVAKRNISRKFYPILEEYSRSPFIQGIYLQLPSADDSIPLANVMSRLPPGKDVGGMHFINRGMSTYPRYRVESTVHPPELLAIAEILKEFKITLKGADIIIIASGTTIEHVKLLSGFLFDRGCNVKILHSAGIPGVTDGSEARLLRKITAQKQEKDIIINRKSEIIITWTNRAGWLTNSRVSPKSTIIDLGYKFARGKVSGDCDFQSIARSARHVTPVPGGVRNVTHLFIFQNLLSLIELQLKQKDDVRDQKLRRRFRENKEESEY